MRTVDEQVEQTVDEQIELSRQVMATAEVIGHVLSATAADLIVADLGKYPFLVCCNALKVCRAEIRSRLTLSDIVTRINAHDGRPGREEAWSIALQSSDERDTVVWTREIHLALEAARPVLASGNKIAARMTFIEAYDRLVTRAREAGMPAEWAASIGWDRELRVAALEQAVKLERLLPSQAEAFLALAGPMSPDGAAIAAVLAGPESGALMLLTADDQTRQALASGGGKASAPSPETRERLVQLRADMAAHAERRRVEREQRAEALRVDLAQRKDLAERAVANYIKKNPKGSNKH